MKLAAERIKQRQDDEKNDPVFIKRNGKEYEIKNVDGKITFVEVIK